MGVITELSPDGDVTVLKIRDDSIAPVEEDSTSASQEYAIKEQFYLMDGNLYEATSLIAQNDAIVVYPTSGYNCKMSDSVTGQIKAVAEKEATADFTESGNPIVIENGYTANVKGLKVRLEPIQSGSGTPSPDNIRPISGRTETSVNTRNEDNTDSNSVTLNFGDTVYGGEVDFNTGVVTIDKAYITLTGSMTVRKVSVTAVDCFSFDDILPYNAIVDSPLLICDRLKQSHNVLTEAGKIKSTNKKTLAVSFVAGTFVDLQAFQTYCNNSPLQVCYPLETSQTIQLTPVQLRLLKGYNYITADGNINLDYVGTVKEWVEEELDKLDGEKADNSVIGTVEDGATASQAYAVGGHFISGGQFKEVTQAIASGGAINSSNTTDRPIADCLVKQATFSGTTSSNGNIEIDATGEKKILYANTTGANFLTFPFEVDGKSYINIKNRGNLTNISETAVSGTYYYID